MGRGGKIMLGGAALAGLLSAVVAIRTATFRPDVATDFSSLQLAPAPRMDSGAAMRHLAEAVRLRTISHQDPAENDRAEWTKLHDWLVSTYPAAHAAMKREVVAGYSLIYTWPGSDPALKPIVLMAHQDVVPVTAGTEGDWKHPPFDGVVADNAVWGRGAIDNKSSLVGLFEALDALAGGGFKPRRTIILVSGHDEEAGGTGAQAAAALLRARGVRAEFVLDEGQATIEDFALIDRPVSLIGVAEKGYATLRITARGAGGHSSAPPAETAVETLARSVLAVTGAPDPMRFSGPGAEMVKTLAPEAPLLTRVAVANAWLFESLLVKTIGATPSGAATLHTTAAPTMLKGSPKDNVLAQDAVAWINYRIAPGQTVEQTLDRARTAIARPDVELAWDGHRNNPSPISSTRSEGWRLIAGLATFNGSTPVAPALVTAGTDSRYMTPIASDIYRYQPLTLRMEAIKQIHGTNEHLSVANLARMTRFYAQLIATAAR